ncbi:MAG: hypothetical protein LUG61_02550 [Lachnospiraceae bacterium]|nr:hypothetical protein [Lachnospiraceae bacterium]
MDENKQEICDLLCQALQATRQYHDLEDLFYDMDLSGETVTATFQGGGVRRINVTADSGAAMIRDILFKI